MTINWPRTDLPQPLIARRAVDGDREALERLWLLFRHEMSAYTHALPDPDGTYRSERLDSALSDPGWHAWLLLAGRHPIGFALSRAMNTSVHVLNSFFVVAPVRRAGLGTSFAHTVVTHPSGTWAVAYQDVNNAAAGFWPRLAARLDPHWTTERKPVPGQPDLPPDTWVTFHTAGVQHI